MATKQDIDKGIAVNLSGAVPGGHGLAEIRKLMLDEPRERRWVIGQVVASGKNVKFPPDAADQVAPTMQFVEMTGITSEEDALLLAAMTARARARMMGQRTFDEVDAEDDKPGEADGRVIDELRAQFGEPADGGEQQAAGKDDGPAPEDPAETVARWHDGNGVAPVSFLPAGAQASE
jgi:hypothetical protein